MEIKPQDLRVGNLVIANGLHEGKIMTVEGIDRQGTMSPESRVILFKEHHVGEFIKDIKGIELTPEWFKRLGFTSIDGSESGHRECYSIFTFSTTGRRLPFFIGVCENGSYSPIMYHDIHEEIRYVHQLMNLFHALTGEELAIDKTSLI